MALLFMDGFDTLTTSTMLWRKGWLSHGNVGTSAPGRYGGNYLNLEYGGSGYSWRMLPSNLTTICIGMAMRTNGFASNDSQNAQWLRLYDGSDPLVGTGTVQVGFNTNPSGYIRAYRNSGGSAVLLGTASTPNPINLWNYLEFKVTIDPSNGSILVKLNGSTVINLTGINTSATASNHIDSLLLNATVTYGNAGSSDYDDFYFCDTTGTINNDLLGDVRVRAIYPTSDATVQLSRSTGSTNYTLVDENPSNDDTDYVYSLNAGDYDLYGYTFPTLNAGSIVHGVAGTISARKDTTGARSVKSICKSGGTIYEGSANTLMSSYLTFVKVWESDPNNANVKWTSSSFGSANFGVKVA